MRMRWALVTFAAALFGVCPVLVMAQEANDPGTGPDTRLSRHDFFYAGEAKQERMFIVRGGRIVWSYTSDRKGEISDAVLLPNGHILFAHQFGVTEIDAKKDVVWNFDAPLHTEIHTVQPYGRDGVLFIENGDPARVVVMDKKTGKVEHTFPLPVGDSHNIHPQFRRCRLTAKGTLLVAHMDLGKAVEYDMSGKPLWSVEAPGIWDAEPLRNGDVLISGNNSKYVREVNRKGETVWEFTAADAPGLKMDNMQTATRLANGDTLITQWANEWDGTMDAAKAPIQAIEVTPAKKVVWVLRSWTPPAALGPSTTIQMLGSGSKR
ncbi:MAG TPA: PQQ-binding-like beta-propeller repeat protein [Terracidiphilus sp.]|nr:PQQ-binding-like beta-propeller repeat protein [Terracidiphilus sp.]